MTAAWRALRPDDIVALRDLARACDEALGTDEQRLVEAIAAMPGSEAERYSIAVEDGRALAAAGWVELRQQGESRALLRSFARTDARWSKRELTERLHERATSLLREAGRAGWIRADRVLKGDTASLPRETIETYERLGLEFFYMEHEMRRLLDTTLPDPPAIDGIAIERWSAARDTAVGDAYNAAFATRGFEGYSAEGWREYMADAGETFRADLSFVAIAGDEVAGFCLCLVEEDEPDAAWVDTAGLRPQARGRGVGASLVASAMRAMRDAGLRACALRVNGDNAEARRVYERLGFTSARKHVVYRQRVE